MRRNKKMSNKGFSLVELIIVIAIMAILVGVLSPSLLRYVEKTNVSSDVQLAETVRTAVTTAILDPAVIEDSTNSAKIFTSASASAGSENNYVPFTNANTTGEFAKAVVTTLGQPATTTGEQLETYLNNKVKSFTKDAAGPIIQVKVSNESQVSVRIKNTDKSGGKAGTTDEDDWITVGEN